MIHDLTDLESLVQQYDHEQILVGPLFDLWANSSFRVFNIAGKSGKIYETIGLGFFELEMDAQRRRADIVATLKGCFGEVKVFDSQLDMAQMAHTLWANNETARFLATVAWQAKPRPTRETDNRTLAVPNKVKVLSGDRNNESRNKEACMAVTRPDVIAGLTHAPQSAGGQVQPWDLAQIVESVNLRNLSDADIFENPGTLPESGSNLGPVRNLPAAVAGSSVSKKYRLWALSAAYFALCFVVGFFIGTTVFTSFTSVRQTANEATFSRNAAALSTVGNGGSQATGTVTDPIPASSIGIANREAPPRDPGHVTSPSLLTSQPGRADDEADTAQFRARSLQKPSARSGAARDEQQSAKAQGNQADDSISLPQSSPPQTVETGPSATLSIPQPPEPAPIQVFVSRASTQIVAGHDESQLSPSDPAVLKAPEAFSTEQQRQASNSAIVPLPRPHPEISAVSSDRPHRRIRPLGEGTRSPARTPLFSLFGH